jgi:hypothetical protein
MQSKSTNTSYERAQQIAREIERRKGRMSLREAASKSAAWKQTSSGLPVQSDKSGGWSRQ